MISRNSLFALLEVFPDPGILLQNDQIIYSNSKFARILRYKDTVDLIGKSLYQIISKEEKIKLDTMLKTFSSMKHISEIFNSELSFIDKLNREMPATIRLYQIEKAEGISLLYCYSKKYTQDDLASIKGQLEFFKMLVSDIQEVIWEFDLQSMRFIYFSKAVEKTLGYTQEEALSLTLADVLTSDSLEKVIKIIHEAKKNVKNGTYNYRSVAVEQYCKDMTIVQTEISGSFVFNEIKNTHYFIGVTRLLNKPNVSTETSLVNKMIESIPVAACSFKASRLLCANAAFRELMELEDNSPIEDKSLFSFFNPANHEIIKKKILLPTDKQSLQFTQCVACREDKTTFPALYNIQQIKQNGEHFNLCFLMDASEHRMIAESLPINQQHLQYILESFSEGFWEYDYQTQGFYASQRLYSILGYEPKEFSPLLSSWMGIIHPTDLDAVKELVQKVDKGKENRFELECRVIRKTGEWSWIILRGSTVSYTAENYPLHVVGTVQDVTTKKQIEIALNETEARYKDLLNKSPYSACISDIKTNEILYLNKRTQELFRLIPNENHNYSLIDLFAFPEQYNNFIQQIKKKCEIAEYEVLCKTLTGRTFWTLVTANLIDFKKRKAIYVAFTDISEMKQMHSQLKENEERYKQLVENAPYPVLVSDIVTNLIVHANKRTAIILDTPLHEIVGSMVNDIYKENIDRELFVENIKMTGSISDWEVKLQNKKGKTFWALVSGNIIRFNGTACAFISLNDITKRKETELALRQSESRFRMLTEHIKDVIWETDKDFCFIYISPADFSMRGFMSQEVIGKTIFDFIPEELHDNLSLEQKIRNVTKNYKYKQTIISIDDMIVPMLTKSGGYIWAEVSISPIIEKDHLVGYRGSTRDVTERVKDEEKIRQLSRFYELTTTLSSKLLQSSVDEINIAIQEALRLLCDFERVDRIFIFRIDYDELNWSITHEYCRDKRYSTRNCPPNSIFPYWIDRLAHNEHIYYPNVPIANDIEDNEKQLLLDLGMCSLVALPLYFNNQLLGYLELDSISRFISWDDKQIGLLKLASDNIACTLSRKKDTVALIESRKIAERANLAKSQFIANISHEIRTPLNAVLGFSDLLESMSEDSKQKQYIHSIKTAGQALLTLINDVLDLSKIEAGMLEIHNSKLSIHEIFEEMEQVFALPITQKALEFTITLDPLIPDYLYLDEIRVRQILLNLIGNSLKFTDRGSIQLSATVQRIDNTKGTIDLSIFIEDTGIGIAEDEQESIFEAFKQQSYSTEKRYEGTGLGLTITRKLVEMLNGKITVYSKPKVGSHFEIVLFNVAVAHDEIKDNKKKDFSLEKITFDEHTILLIDGNKAERNKIKMLLQQTGLIVIEGNTVAEAIDSLNKELIDLVIFDYTSTLTELSNLMQYVALANKGKNIILFALIKDLPVETQDALIKSKIDTLISRPIDSKNLVYELSRYFTYTVKNIKERTESLQSLQNVDEEKLSAIYKQFVHEITPLLQQFSAGYKMRTLWEFADKVTKFGKKNELWDIVDYGKSLVKAADDYDLNLVDLIILQLKRYPDKIKQVRSSND